MLINFSKLHNGREQRAAGGKKVGVVVSEITESEDGRDFIC